MIRRVVAVQQAVTIHSATIRFDCRPSPASPSPPQPPILPLLSPSLIHIPPSSSRPLYPSPLTLPPHGCELEYLVIIGLWTICTEATFCQKLILLESRTIGPHERVLTICKLQRVSPAGTAIKFLKRPQSRLQVLMHFLRLMCPDQRRPVGLMRSLGVTAPYLAKLTHLAASSLLTTYCWPPVTDNRSREERSKSTTFVETGVVIEGKDWD